MARGDVIADIYTANTSSSVSIQPAAGVEWLLKCFAGNNDGNVRLRATDGSTNIQLMKGDIADAIGGVISMPVTNSNYAQFYNASSGSSTSAFLSGFVTKD